MAKLPSLRALIAELRELHTEWSHPIAGGEYVCLARMAVSVVSEWQVVIDDGSRYSGFGREWIPGDGARFDAVAAARRLLVAARDAGGA